MASLDGTYGAEAGWVSMSDFWYQDFMTWGQCDRAGRILLATTQDVRVFDGAALDRFQRHKPWAWASPRPQRVRPQLSDDHSEKQPATFGWAIRLGEGACGVRARGGLTGRPGMGLTPGFLRAASRLSRRMRR
jgi:hypothetical protein